MLEINWVYERIKKMVKKKFAKIMTATLVASMIMGMTVVANAEDEASLSAQAKALEAQADTAADNAESAELKENAEGFVGEAKECLTNANSILEQAKTARDNALAAVVDEMDEDVSAEQGALNEANEALTKYESEKQKYIALLDAYNAMKAEAKKCTITPYSGNDTKYGKEEARLDGKTYQPYWDAAQKFFKLCLEFLYGDNADFSISDKNPESRTTGMPKGTNKTTYANYWEVTYTKNGKTVTKDFNYHTLNAEGDIYIVEKTWHPAVEVSPAVSAKDAVWAYLNTNKENYEDNKASAKDEIVLDDTDNTADPAKYIATSVFDIKSDSYKYVKEGSEKTNIEHVTVDVVDSYYKVKEQKYGYWERWNYISGYDAVDDIKDWMGSQAYNSVKVTYTEKHLFGDDEEKELTLKDMSGWSFFFKELWALLSGSEFNVEYYSANVKQVDGIKVTTTAEAKEHKINKYSTKTISTTIYYADKYTYQIAEAAVEGKDAVVEPGYWTEVTLDTSAITSKLDDVSSKLATLNQNITNANTALVDKGNQIITNNNLHNETSAAFENAQAEVDSINGSIEVIEAAVERAENSLSRFVTTDDNTDDVTPTENTTPDANVPANVDVITDNVNVAADDANAAPAMNANLLVAQAPVAANQAPAVENVADENVPQASAKQVENVSDEAVPQASAADESHTSWLWLIILIVAVAAAITGYTIYRKNRVEE